MKKTVFRSFAALLSIVILFCTFSPAVSATVAELNAEKADTVNYVSLGASNTNGYGHVGYLPPEVTEDPLAASKANLNTYGYLRQPKASYPYQIAQALKSFYGVDNVNLSQLAISSMRTEELRVLLDNSYYGDEYTEWRFTGGQKWFEIAEPGGLAALRASYQNAIANADVITVDMGWNNFGVFAFNNIKSALASGTYWNAPDFSQLEGVDEQIKYTTIKQIALNYLESDVGITDSVMLERLDMVSDILAYAAIGSCYHFDIVMEKIYELNPDAKVVVINIQNLADDLVVDLMGNELELGDLYGKLISMVDTYRRSASPFADRYMFADAGDVTTFLDEIIEWDGDPKTLTGDVKDCFDMYDDNLYVRSIIEYMMVGQALSGVFSSVRTMAASEGLQIFDDSAPYVKDAAGYIYEFALDMAWLQGVNLGALNLQNPSTDLEKYGSALSVHLKNLRAQNYDAYDYAFDAVLEALKAQKNSVAAQKAAAEAEKAELENMLSAVTDAATIAQIEAGIAQYEAGIAQAEEGLAKLEYGITALLPGAQAQFKAALRGIYVSYQNTLDFAYGIAATVVQRAAKINSVAITPDSFKNFGSVSDKPINYIYNSFVEGSTVKFYYELQKNGIQETGVTTDPVFVMDETLFADVTTASVAALDMRYGFGNSFFAHPSTKGHDEITDSVILTLAKGKTAKEDTNDDITAAWNWMMDLVHDNFSGAYDVYLNIADYIGSDEFASLCKVLEGLYHKLDFATTAEQRDALVREIYYLVGRFQEIASMATAKKLENIDYYVSIGDSILTGYGLDKYVSGENNGEGQIVGDEAPVLLAKKLFGENYDSHFKKLDKGGLRTEDLLVWLGEDEFIDDFYLNYTVDNSKNTTADKQKQFIEEVKKADFITLALGGGNITTFLDRQLERLEKGEPLYEMDWTKYFPDAEIDEIHAYVDDMAKMLEGTLPEIMGIPAEKFTPVLVESFLYGLVSYTRNYPLVIDRIHEINPNAHVVIVGYFNPADGMKIPVTLEGEAFNVPAGAMLGALIGACNIGCLSYAIDHKDNTTFVSVSETTTILDEQGKFDPDSRLNGIINETWLTHAGVEGHKYIAQQIYTSITTEYTNKEIALAVDEDSFYVALGDGAAAGESYVDIFAEALGVDFENLAEAGQTFEDALAVLEENAELIKKADVITLGYSNASVTEFVFSQMNALISGSKPEKMDWDLLVGEDTVFVESAVAALAATLATRGLGEKIMGVDLAELITLGVESYVYAYTARAVLYPKLIDAVSELAPDALIIIVGAYNDFEGTVFEANGTEIDIGAIIGRTVEFANLSSFYYTVNAENNVLYVGAPNVESIFAADLAKGEYEAVNLLTYFNAIINGDFAPSEEGHAYIAEKILASLEITKKGPCDDGHKFGDWATVKPATETEAGTKERTCSVCGHKETETIPMLEPTVTTPVTTAPVETTPVETTTPAPTVTTPTVTTTPSENSQGGCGGIAIATQLIALICAAGAAIVIKKK